MNERMNEIEVRLAEIRTALDAPEADLDALEAEVRALNAEKAELTEKAEKRAALIEDVANTATPVEVFEEIKTEERKMTNEEVRSGKEYINAYANYIKSGDDTECRSLLTEIVGGRVPVPTYIEGRVRQAWEKNDLMQYVRKTYLAGIVKIGFEVSADGAVVHTEGTSAPSEENLVLGIVTLTPASIKKWIRISDEALDLGGQEFLDYIYDEIAYQIAKKAADELIGTIKTLGTSVSTSSVGAAQVKTSPTLGAVASAMANLSDQAGSPVVVMNKGTWGAFKAAQYAASFPADPFEGLPVVFNNTLPTYASASTSGVWAIVGDFGYGAQANFPNGDTITFKFDDLSEAEADLVKVVGREYVALGAVAPGAFVNLIK